jgi:hypothetical protein
MSRWARIPQRRNASTSRPQPANLLAACSRHHGDHLERSGREPTISFTALNVLSGRAASWAPIGTKTFTPQSQVAAGDLVRVSAAGSNGLAWVTAVDVQSLDYKTAFAP